jgi:dihydroorotase
VFGMVLRLNTRGYRYVVAEPNSYLDASKPEHHIETAEDVEKYREQVESVKERDPKCEILYLIKITPRTKPEMVERALDVGAIGGKLYPDGVTNMSENGVTDFFSSQLYECFSVFQARNAIVQEHPEMPGEFSMRREWRYGDVIRRHATDFPNLRFFAEHLTDRRSLSLLELPNVRGTVTGHHLRLTLDDVLGCDANHCRPNAKEPEDRAALVAAALSGDERIISITDSAFHKWWRKKLLTCACAGVFNPSEIAIPWLMKLFWDQGDLQRPFELLERFACLNGCTAYGLRPPAPDDLIELICADTEVPQMYFAGKGMEDCAIPFLAGETLPFRLAPQ